MKILHITNSSGGGAGIAAFRLHKALIKVGIQSAYLSTNLSINYKNEVFEDEFFSYKKPSVLKKIVAKLLPSQFLKSQRKLAQVRSDLDCEIATLPFSHYKMHLHPLVQQADVINLHWVSGIINYPSFFRTCNKAIVWTLHDMNPFQGLFHYSGDQVKNSIHVRDFDEEIKNVKAIAIAAVSKGATITPSQWLLDEAKEACFFSQSKKLCIPNSIDLDVFKLQDKIALRKTYGIAEDAFVLLFVAESLDNSRKGLDLLLESFKYLKAFPITIMTIGMGEISGVDFKTIALGKVKTPAKMAECYGLADVFILPSREDNLPNVMLESFACGTPLISFNLGGMKAHVVENRTGLLADELTGESLAKSIAKFYKTSTNYNGGVIRKYAEENFSFENQAKAYLKVYTELIN